MTISDKIQCFIGRLAALIFCLLCWAAVIILISNSCTDRSSQHQAQEAEKKVKTEQKIPSPPKGRQ